MAKPGRVPPTPIPFAQRGRGGANRTFGLTRAQNLARPTLPSPLVGEGECGGAPAMAVIQPRKAAA
jgi:hypothetical protein